jgi:glucokinase
MSKIGIEIGGTKLQIVSGNPSTGKVDQAFRHVVDRRLGSFGILKQIEQTMENLERPPSHIAIGFGGPVLRSKGIIATSHQIDGWSGFELTAWFKEKYKVPVELENDANTAALGEAICGAGRGYRYVFYVTLGSGVGGGMVTDGKLYHGGEPGEAEIGLMHIDPNGNTVESLCSGWSLNRRIRKEVANAPKESFLKQCIIEDGNNESCFLLPSVEKGDPIAVRLFEEYTSDLAWSLSHIVSLFNPEVIILGGGVSKMGSKLVQAVEDKIQVHVVKAYRNQTKIVLSQLGEQAVPIGALCLMREQLVESTTLSSKSKVDKWKV